MHNFSEIPLAGCRGVMIDLDDTLYAYEPAHREALARVHTDLFADQPFPLFARAYRAARDRVVERLSPQGVCRSRLLAFLHMFEEARADRSFARAYAADALYWDSFIAVMACDPAAAAFVDRCADAGIPVCVVSDMTTHIQIRKLDRLGLGGRIAHLVTSEEVGAEKPDPRMFQEGMRKLAVTVPGEVLMVGDSLVKDVRGAQALGIPAYLISLGGRHATSS